VQNILYHVKGGLLLLLFLLKMVLDSVLIKKSFHTRKKFHFLMTTRVRSRLAYLEKEKFPSIFIYRDCTERMTKSIHRQKKYFRSISNLLRLHRVRGKEHTQINKIRNLEIKHKKPK
jgi:hypothetical protein